MKLKELRDKSREELNRLYIEFCGKRQEFNFKVASQGLKKVRDIREIKRTIARILTILKEQSITK
mgnify:CR=1 FL=1